MQRGDVGTITATHDLDDELLKRADECKRRGCHLYHLFSIEKLRSELIHWRDGHEYVPDVVMMPKTNFAVVDAWLDALHAQQEDADGGLP